MIEADYVIAGGGSAGCVLAARLTEDPDITVVLLEAGGPSDNFKVRMPTGSYMLLGRPEYDWMHLAEPDPSVDGRQVMYSAGRMLGGGSAINGMVYIRGARADYDGWAAAGCDGWGWSDVLPYFKKSEHYVGPPSQAHSSFGTLGVTEPRKQHPLVAAFVDACTEVGLRRVEDYSAGDIDGTFTNLVTQERGERSSAARAFLEPALKRPNLTVLTGALVDKVLIEGGRATGVRYLEGDQPRTVRARREVIVSAGTLSSPAILLRSGIGPAEALAAHGIAVEVDAPMVGRNLQEHISFATSRTVDMPTYNTMMKGPFRLARQLLTYVLFRRGLMSAVPVEGMAFLRSEPGLAEPDIKLQFGAVCFDPVKRKPHDEPGVVVFANVAKPKSRGEIRLRSADPKDKPIVDHRLLGHPDDAAAMVRGMKEVDRIFRAPSLARHVTGMVMPPAPPQSDEEWAALLRANCGIGYHPVGTCAMGGDPSSVTDARLRVRGVAGLRVVDASVMPVMPAANTNAPAIMIGEKGADLIKQDRVA